VNLKPPWHAATLAAGLFVEIAVLALDKAMTILLSLPQVCDFIPAD
jgi:hypothetical protein